MDCSDMAERLLSDNDMRKPLDDQEYPEKQLEDAQIAAIFEARKDSVAKTGPDLKTKAFDAFEQRSDELMDLISTKEAI